MIKDGIRHLIHANSIYKAVYPASRIEGLLVHPEDYRIERCWSYIAQKDPHPVCFAHATRKTFLEVRRAFPLDPFVNIADPSR